jgi:hypothetical protein
MARSFAISSLFISVTDFLERGNNSCIPAVEPAGHVRHAFQGILILSTPEEFSGRLFL